MPVLLALALRRGALRRRRPRRVLLVAVLLVAVRSAVRWRRRVGVRRRRVLPRRRTLACWRTAAVAATPVAAGGRRAVARPRRRRRIGRGRPGGRATALRLPARFRAKARVSAMQRPRHAAKHAAGCTAQTCVRRAAEAAPGARERRGRSVRRANTHEKQRAAWLRAWGQPMPRALLRWRRRVPPAPPRGCQPRSCGVGRRAARRQMRAPAVRARLRRCAAQEPCAARRARALRCATHMASARLGARGGGARGGSSEPYESLCQLVSPCRLPSPPGQAAAPPAPRATSSIGHGGSTRRMARSAQTVPPFGQGDVHVTSFSAAPSLCVAEPRACAQEAVGRHHDAAFGGL